MAGYNEIVLAAWLHDIGKFAQRAGDEHFKDLDSRSHVSYTESFLRKVRDCLPTDVRVDEVIRLASAHHSPDAYDEWVIAHGDRLSNGADKCDTDPEGGNRKGETRAEFENPLVHLVSSLHIKEKPRPKVAYSPLEPMDGMDGKAIFAGGKDNVGKYPGLWRKFEGDFYALKGLPYSEFIQSLDTLMERYCWCIPSSPMQDADISLYQHSKMAAAFAATLFRYYEGKGTNDGANLAPDGENVFLFIQGDASGIQKYIFDLKTTADNAKLLRARSFQVWALSDIIAEYLARQIGVSRENIVTSSGGKFLLLAPNTESANAERLSELRLELERHFLKEFAGKIAFVLSEGVPASSADLRTGTGNIQKLLNKIGKCGEEAKQKKLQTVLGKDGHLLDELYGKLQKNGVCEWCETLDAARKRDGRDICENCDDLIEIGRKLVKASKITLNAERLAPFAEMVKVLPKDDGTFGYLTEYQKGFPVIPLPYAAPVDKQGNIRTFEDIVKEGATGNKKLAMFKADIDNLGLVFTSSWGEGDKSRISFSRYAQLSRHLHYFFSAYVSSFIKNRDEYKDTIYTVFSGGDDLCVLGAWDAVMRFALDFRNELAAFANGNPSVTLSGGIALADSKLPVRTIADAAEEALDHAKKREDKKTNEIKDAVSVFGVTVSWAEYKKSLEDAKEIVEYMSSGKVSYALVYKMIDFANRARDIREGRLKDFTRQEDRQKMIRDSLWMSNYRYVLARNIKPGHENVLKFFQQFGSPDLMEKSRIAVSYALYLNRGKEEE